MGLLLLPCLSFQLALAKRDDKRTSKYKKLRENCNNFLQQRLESVPQLAVAKILRNDLSDFISHRPLAGGEIPQRMRLPESPKQFAGDSRKAEAPILAAGLHEIDIYYF